MQQLRTLTILTPHHASTPHLKDRLRHCQRLLRRKACTAWCSCCLDHHMQQLQHEMQRLLIRLCQLLQQHRQQLGQQGAHLLGRYCRSKGCQGLIPQQPQRGRCRRGHDCKYTHSHRSTGSVKRCQQLWRRLPPEVREQLHADVTCRLSLRIVESCLHVTQCHACEIPRSLSPRRNTPRLLLLLCWLLCSAGAGSACWCIGVQDAR